MKKYFYVILMVILFVPMIVFGDSSGPRVLGYDAVIINPNGAKVHDSTNVISYNTKVHVYDEVDYIDDTNNKYAVVCNFGDESCNRWDSNAKYILLTDIAPLKEEISPKDIKDIFGNDDYNDEVFFSLSNNKFIVFEKEGINLSKGPSDIYGKYSLTIPYMTYIKASYVLESGGGEDNPVIYWYYIDDGVNKGWLKQTSNFLGYNIGIFKESKLVFTDVNIYDEDNKIVLTIPSETLLNDIYYIGQQQRYFIKYDGKEGYTKDDNFGTKVPGLILTLNNTNIISIDGKVYGSIPMGKIVDNVYGYFYSSDRGPEGISGVSGINNKKYYYVEYNKIKGFIIDSDAMSFVTYNNSEQEEYVKKNILSTKVVLTEDTNMYEYLISDDYYYSLGDEIIKTIPSGETVTFLCSREFEIQNKNNKQYEWVDFVLINYQGTLGWIKDNTNQNSNMNNNQTPENIPINDNSTKANNKKSDNTIYYAIAGAVIVCIIAIIIIIMINKRKKDNKERKVEEIKKDDVSSNNEREPVIHNKEGDMEKKD